MASRSFIEELKSEDKSGVAYKSINSKKAVLSFLSRSKNATIPELSRELNLSVPKVTSILNELLEDGLVQYNGKIDSTGGRRANVYGLDANSGFFVAIDVKQHFINLGLIDFQNNLIKIEEHYPY